MSERSSFKVSRLDSALSPLISNENDLPPENARRTSRLPQGDLLKYAYQREFMEEKLE